MSTRISKSKATIKTTLAPPAPESAGRSGLTLTWPIGPLPPLGVSACYSEAEQAPCQARRAQPALGVGAPEGSAPPELVQRIAPGAVDVRGCREAVSVQPVDLPRSQADGEREVHDQPLRLAR